MSSPDLSSPTLSSQPEPRTLESVLDEIWGRHDGLEDDFAQFNLVFIQLTPVEQNEVLDGAKQVVEETASIDDVGERMEEVKMRIYRLLLKYEKDGQMDLYRAIRIEANPDDDEGNDGPRPSQITGVAAQMLQEINRVDSQILIIEQEIAELMRQLNSQQPTTPSVPVEMFQARSCPCEKKDFQARTTGGCQCGNCKCNKCQFRSCGCPFANLKEEEDK
jgi:hypothetical protein